MRRPPRPDRDVSDLHEVCVERGVRLMIDEELQALCDARAKAVLDSTSDLAPMLRVVVLTGTLAAAACAAGVSRQNVIDAINSCFDDVEAGEIPGDVR